MKKNVKGASFSSLKTTLVFSVRLQLGWLEIVIFIVLQSQKKSRTLAIERSRERRCAATRLQVHQKSSKPCLGLAVRHHAGLKTNHFRFSGNLCAAFRTDDAAFSASGLESDVTKGSCSCKNSQNRSSPRASKFQFFSFIGAGQKSIFLRPSQPNRGCSRDPKPSALISGAWTAV